MSVVLEEVSPAAIIAAAKERLAKIRAESARLESERQRCIAEAERHRKIIDAVAIARAALAELHDARASHQTITDKQIAQAEANLQHAQEMAGRSELAEIGAKAAARRYAEQSSALTPQAAAIRAEARAALATMLRDRVEESRAQYRRDAEAFTEGVHARHHGTIAAIREFALRNGMQDLARTHAIPCPPAGLPEFLGTGTQSDPAAAFTLDARPAIATETAEVAAELAQLTAGLL